MFIAFREKGREVKTETERQRGLHPLTGDQTCNLGVCPD